MITTCRIEVTIKQGRRERIKANPWAFAWLSKQLGTVQRQTPTAFLEWMDFKRDLHTHFKLL